jgi:hypothetical protein
MVHAHREPLPPRTPAALIPNSPGSPTERPHSPHRTRRPTRLLLRTPVPAGNLRDVRSDDWSADSKGGLNAPGPVETQLEPFSGKVRVIIVARSSR